MRTRDHPYIQFDESEYLHSTVSDCTLRAVALLFDKYVADKLLYRSEPYVRTYYRNGSYRLEKRVLINRIRNCRIRVAQAASGKETVEAFYPLASGG